MKQRIKAVWILMLVVLGACAAEDRTNGVESVEEQQSRLALWELSMFGVDSDYDVADDLASMVERAEAIVVAHPVEVQPGRRQQFDAPEDVLETVFVRMAVDRRVLPAEYEDEFLLEVLIPGTVTAEELADSIQRTGPALLFLTSGFETDDGRLVLHRVTPDATVVEADGGGLSAPGFSGDTPPYLREFEDLSSLDDLATEIAGITASPEG